jgi:CO/xanthine dehydrogenase Mo-binding subunit
VAHVLGLPEGRVKVVQAPTGGAFGGKEDYPSFLGAYAALLANKCGRPVRMLLDRQEDLAFTPKRHASWTCIKAGVKRDGTLTALQIELVLDGGAYTTLTPLVLSRGAIHAQGSYHCPNIRVTAKAFRSNIPPAGAFRGFGAPQSQFAVESHMDEVAARLNIDPASLRRKNVILKGDAIATGQVLKESVGSKECLESVVRICGYDERRRAAARFNMSSKRHRRGLGLALFWHGAGFIGDGEQALAPEAMLELMPSGTVEIRVSSTELGQGAATALSQIVAHTCGIDLSFVRFAQPDTSRVPDSGPTVASRTTMIVGRLLERCSRDLMKAVEQRVGKPPTWFEDADRALEDGPLTVCRCHEPAGGLSWDERRHRGDAYPAYSWGAVAVEVSVDPWYGRITPIEVWCAVEIGKAIHPKAAVGQVEGGLIQALGYGLLERLTLSGEGAFLENSFQDYHLPTTTELPRLHVDLIELPCSHGPLGAKGLGELPVNGLAPALGNALRQALGVRLDSIPFSRERIAGSWI